MTTYRLASLTVLFCDILNITCQSVNSQLGKQDLSEFKARLDITHSNYAFQKGSNVLLVVPTANVLHRTRSLLQSLSAIEDDFDLLIVDELSMDGTRKYFEERNIKFISPGSANGVTYNWNLAYHYFMKHKQYDIMFLSNNDVLIPNGVINELARTLSECDCDLISPLSTTRGKGHRPQESIENVFGLNDKEIQKFVNIDINYQIVQDTINFMGQTANNSYCSLNTFQDSFNGFFFGFRKNIQRIAFDEKTLFNQKNRNIGQEDDLTQRLRQNRMKICLNTITFVYHYKASTIPGNIDREKFGLKTVNF